jgi:hypothetical protein
MYHKTDNNMSYVAQHWQPYLMPIGFSVVKRMACCCQYCDTQEILLSVLWQAWDMVVSVALRRTYCCQFCDDNNMSYVLQHWQRYILRITTLSTLCITYHNTMNNMFYVSQHWQQYALRITTLIPICLTYQLSVLWYIRHIVDIVVIRKRYRCQYCDA